MAERVKSRVGDEVAVRGEAVGIGELVLLAVGVAVSVAEPGVVAVAVGLGLPEGGVDVSAVAGVVTGVGVPVFDGPGLADGDGSGTGVPEGAWSDVGKAMASICAKAGMLKEPSAEESKGKERNNKSPASDKAPAELNRGTITLSS